MVLDGEGDGGLDCLVAERGNRWLLLRECAVGAEQAKESEAWTGMCRCGFASVTDAKATHQFVRALTCHYTVPSTPGRRLGHALARGLASS